MLKRGEPVIKDSKEDWTRISFVPDFAKFHMEARAARARARARARPPLRAHRPSRAHPAVVAKSAVVAKFAPPARTAFEPPPRTHTPLPRRASRAPHRARARRGSRAPAAPSRPDMRCRGGQGMEEDTYRLLERRTYDLAGVTHSSVKVWLNGKKLGCNNFSQASAAPPRARSRARRARRPRRSRVPASARARARNRAPGLATVPPRRVASLHAPTGRACALRSTSTCTWAPSSSRARCRA